MTTLNQKEIEKAFKESKIDTLKYYVEVEGRTFTSDFTYGGLRDIQWFIHEYGKPNKSYNILVIKDGE